MAGWRQRNGCSDASEKIYEKGDAVCLRWGACQQGSEVILCTLKGGGHTWPGGVPIPFLGKTSSDLSATRAMLDFFEAHPMP
jgi:polyhydroxybutyrate depolymerase